MGLTIRNAEPSVAPIDPAALVAVLDPDVVLRADLGPLPAGGSREVRGAAAVAGQAQTYSRLGLHMQLALINGAAGVVSTRDGQPFSVGGCTVKGGKIVEIDILADPARLSQLDLTILDNERSPICGGAHAVIGHRCCCPACRWWDGGRPALPHDVGQPDERQASRSRIAHERGG